MKLQYKSTGILSILTVIASVPVHAQSSVTLYGAVDDSIAYQSSQTSLGSTSGGRSNIKTASGVWYGDRFGFKGTDDLGAGSKAIFQLESGFNLSTGGQQYTNAEFGRISWVGLTNPAYGTLTLGHQYTSYYSLLSPYSPALWLTGFFGAHPGDVDELDSIYRANNSVVYVSPTFYGFVASASYSLAGIPGSVNQGSTWSGAVRYVNGPFGIAAGITRINNSTPGGGVFGADSTANSGGEAGVSAVTNGYQTAQAQQRIALTGGYTFTPSLDVSFSYSNVQYIPGVNSSFSDIEIFNTAGAVLHWKPAIAIDLSAGYSYTRATKANAITSAARYQQFNLSQYYSLSKRTGFYAVEAYQRANGQTLGTAGSGHVIDATASVGDGFQGAPSSSRSQFAAGLGLVHRF